MDGIIEHTRFGPVAMSCDRNGMANCIEKLLVRNGTGNHRKITLCSACQKEVMADENTPGSYSSSKPHVVGFMRTISDHTIYYPVKGFDNLVFPVDVDGRISKRTKEVVSELIAKRR